jgi:hypothetical protein
MRARQINRFEEPRIAEVNERYVRLMCGDGLLYLSVIACEPLISVRRECGRETLSVEADVADDDYK